VGRGEMPPDDVIRAVYPDYRRERGQLSRIGLDHLSIIAQ